MTITELLNTQHADYEHDLEPDNYGLDNDGLDDCPFDDPTPLDLSSDIRITIPCGYCGFTDCDCTPDAGSPYGHINTRRGW